MATLIVKCCRGWATVDQILRTTTMRNMMKETVSCATRGSQGVSGERMEPDASLYWTQKIGALQEAAQMKRRTAENQIRRPSSTSKRRTRTRTQTCRCSADWAEVQTIFTYLRHLSDVKSHLQDLLCFRRNPRGRARQTGHRTFRGPPAPPRWISGATLWAAWRAPRWPRGRCWSSSAAWLTWLSDAGGVPPRARSLHLCCHRWPVSMTTTPAACRA